MHKEPLEPHLFVRSWNEHTDDILVECPHHGLVRELPPRVFVVSRVLSATVAGEVDGQRQLRKGTVGVEEFDDSEP